MKKKKRPKTHTSMKSGGIDDNTLLIAIIVLLITNIFIGVCS